MASKNDVARTTIWLMTALLFAGCTGSSPASVNPQTTVLAPSTTQIASTSAPEPDPATSVDTPFSGTPDRLRVEVIERFDHDVTALTQGLVAIPGGFYESTGNYGSSELRRVSETGEIESRRMVDDNFFAEGLELHRDRLIQLTWKEETALVYDAATFELTDSYHYDGEGWGLCTDGDRFVMSNGTDRLTFRSLDTFDVLGTVSVTVDGAAQSNLNELECVDGRVYANVWQTDLILRIDPDSGEVDQLIDASGLLSTEEAAQANVLNGIAAAGDGGFYVTGKYWPALFRVRFVPA